MPKPKSTIINLEALRQSLGHPSKNLNQHRREEAIRKAAANHANRKTKAHLYMLPAWGLSSVMTANGFFLTAQEAGLDGFKGVLLAALASIVAAVLIGGSSAMLLDMASEMEG